MNAARTILVIDDDPDLREVIADALEEEGHLVISAEHGRAALEVLERLPDLPDVILLDVMMPVMDGFAFVEELRNRPRLAHIPMVIFTAHADHRGVAARMHATASVKKPLKLEDLLSVVESVTPRLRNADERRR